MLCLDNNLDGEDVEAEAEAEAEKRGFTNCRIGVRHMVHSRVKFKVIANYRASRCGKIEGSVCGKIQGSVWGKIQGSMWDKIQVIGWSRL